VEISPQLWQELSKGSPNSASDFKSSIGALQDLQMIPGTPFLELSDFGYFGVSLPGIGNFLTAGTQRYDLGNALGDKPPALWLAHSCQFSLSIWPKTPQILVGSPAEIACDL
jgi:hypothetical protein